MQASGRAEGSCRAAFVRYVDLEDGSVRQDRDEGMRLVYRTISGIQIPDSLAFILSFSWLLGGEELADSERYKFLSSP